jgi:O-antigen/teichoic acid export membrane protein
MSAAPGLGRRLVANTMHAATGRVAAIVVWLVLTPPILGALGPDGFAVWSLFFALTGYFGALDFGLAQGTLQRVAAARERGDLTSGGAFATLAALGYVVLGLVWLTVTLAFRGPIMDWLRVPDEVRGAAGFAIVAGAGVFTLSGLANITMAINQACGRFDLANRVLLTLTAQQAIGIPIVLAMHWGLAGLVVNVGLGWTLGLALGLMLLRRAEPEFHWGSASEALRHTRAVIRFGGPMQIGNALSVIHSHLDKFLLARFVALAAVTPYELGFRVATAANGVPQLLLLAVLPAAAAIHAGETPERLRELYRRANRYVLAAGAITLAVLLGSADRLYLTWLGPGHAGAALALRGIAIAGSIAIATGMGTTVARGIARTDLEAWFAAVALVTHLALSLWLMPKLGIAGALIAIIAANFIGATLFITLLARTLSWPAMHLLLEPCGVPVVAVAVGAVASFALDRALPAARGPLAWAILALVAAVAGGLALAVTLVTRFVRIRELSALLLARGEEAPSRS